MSAEKTDEKNIKSTSTDKYFKLKVTLLGIYHMVMILVLVYFLLKVWPDYSVGENGQRAAINYFNLLGWNVQAGSEAGLLLLVVIASALGSYIHAATSFVSYVGNKSLVMSWAWWYILRPFIGVALALVFYFVIRGGLLSVSTEAGDISIFGITAVAGLVGMFSKQATDKLGEVFDTLFKTKEGGGDQTRKDKLGELELVTEKMIPLNKIIFFTIPESKSPGEIKLEELYELLSETVTRVPVLNEKNILKFVIHQSIIFKFIVESGISASDSSKPFDVKNLTLDDFLNYPGIRELVEDAIAIVPANATIIEAKEVMEEIKSCQDVFITKNGNREEEVLGWLTNVDITKCLSE
jgi:hypothetical protein